MIRFNKQNNKISTTSSFYYNEEISFYVLILGSLASGNTQIFNISKTEKVLNLIGILKQFGIKIEIDGDNIIVEGKNKKFEEPTNIIDVKNSKETLYLLVGLFASYNFKLFFRGDNSLQNLNLDDIFSCYSDLDVKFIARNDKNLPFLMYGNKSIKPIKKNVLNLKKSLLLTSLSSGKNIIIEKSLQANYLENMFKFFDVYFSEKIDTNNCLGDNVTKRISINSNVEISGKEIVIPTDVNFLNYIATLSIIIPDSNITIPNVLLDQFNDAFIRTLFDYGANITLLNRKINYGYSVADVSIKHKWLKTANVVINRIDKIINEYYLLFLIASVTGVSTRIQGIEYLEKNDNENYKFMLNLLKDLGVNYTEKNDILSINGKIANLDHKINTTDITNINLLLTLGAFGLFLNNKVEINDVIIEKRYPNFVENLKSIGVEVE
ncbi:MAG: hypothetical protein LBT02_00280 [Rickettsiales bacterium]|jgi:3-phosphoshikimate 1-carboxyvinyltransferase|nr:hypothetical protein [Rickettsiales bacterium]